MKSGRKTPRSSLTERRNIPNCLLPTKNLGNEKEARLARCEAVQQSADYGRQKLDRRMQLQEIEELGQKLDHRPSCIVNGFFYELISLVNFENPLQLTELIYNEILS